MIYEIINGLVLQFKEKSLHVYESSGKNLDNYAFPAIFIDVDYIDFENLTRGKYKVILNISIYALVRNYRYDSDLNLHMFNLLEGIIGILCDNNLDLEIEPIRINKVSNVSTEEQRIQKISVYKLDIQTSYIIDKPKREEIYGDLLRIGLEYYLKPGDDALDSMDIVTLK